MAVQAIAFGCWCIPNRSGVGQPREISDVMPEALAGEPREQLIH